MKNYLILALTGPDFDHALVTVLNENDLNVSDGKYIVNQRRWTDGHLTIFCGMVHSPERVRGYQLDKCYITQLLANENPPKLSEMINTVIRPSLFMKDGVIVWL